MNKSQNFFQCGGTLDKDAECYIERPADKEFLNALERDEICLILAPRQTGKSSLVVHAMLPLEKKGIYSIYIDFQNIGTPNDLEGLFFHIIDQIYSNCTDFKVDSIKWWNANKQHTPTQRFINFLQDVVLTEIEKKVVIFFDEIDAILSLPFSDDFFTTIRSIFNARSTNSRLRRLNFVIIGVGTPSSFIKNRSGTPFNIGRSITLEDFARKLIKPFQEKLGPDSNSIIDKIFYWTNGQPFFMHKFTAYIYELPKKKQSIEEIDEIINHDYLHSKIKEDSHLKFIQDYLLDKSYNIRRTLSSYQKVLKQKSIEYDEQSIVHNRLKLAGVVRIEDNKLFSRNRIYQRVFNEQWIKENMPKDIERLVVYSSSFILVLLISFLLWNYFISPLFFPIFPNIPKLIKFTSKSSTEVRIKLSDTNVSQVIIDKVKIFDNGITFFQNTQIKVPIKNLPVGESKHNLQLVGGLLNQIYKIPIEVIYYPDWQIRQFPDERLSKIRPNLKIDYNDLKLKDILNGNIKKLEGHYSKITSAVLSLNRKFIVSGSEDGILKFWHVNVAWALKSFKAHDGSVNCVALAPDGQTVISGGTDNTLKLWNFKTGKRLQTFYDQSEVYAVAFSKDGKKILSGSKDYIVKLRNIITDTSTNQSKKNSNKCMPKLELAIDWNEAKHYNQQTTHIHPLFSGTYSKLNLSINWSELLAQTFVGHIDTVLSVAFSPDGKKCLSGSKDNTIKLWDISTGNILKTLNGHTGAVRTVTFLNDGNHALSGSDDTLINLWDLEKGKTIRTFKGLTDPVKLVEFSQQANIISGKSVKQDLKIWDADTGEELDIYIGHKSMISVVTFSPDGKTVISGSNDGTLKLWNIDTGRLLRTFCGDCGEVWALAFSPDGKTIASNSQNNTIKFWDFTNGKVLRSFSDHEDLILDIAFSPDGKTVVSASKDNTIKLWDIKTSRTVRTFYGHYNKVQCVAFSPDGKNIISGSKDKTLKLWNVDTGRDLRTFYGHDNIISDISFAPNGKTVVSASYDNTLKLWDVNTGEELRTFSGHLKDVLSVTFSPDGKKFISGSSDNTLKLWNVNTGQVLRTFEGHKDEVMSVSFSPDGKTVISGSADNTLKQWWAAIEPK
ncbi:ribosome assembly protein SQT1 [Candidatus Magnetomoraceae bacterium gMMP-1]